MNSLDSHNLPSMERSNSNTHTEPSHIVKNPTITYNHHDDPEPDEEEQTLFTRFYIVKDGFVSFRGRGLMLILATMLATAIFSFFVHYCMTDDRCVVMKPPVISRLLYIKQINVRVYIMLSSVYAYSCLFFNVRINYKRFRTFISPTTNSLLFALGTTTAISQPMLGVFDQHEYFKQHVLFAALFFCSGAFYLIISTTILDRNRHHFSKAD